MAVMHSRYREAGTVTIDRDTCQDCGCCAEICPTGVLRLDAGRVEIRPDSLLGCIACAHCMMVCPQQSVTVTGRGLSPGDVMPVPPPEARATGAALAALLQARRSVRRFTAQEVDPALLERIVTLAASGPMGIPPWDVGCVMVRGRTEVRHVANEIVAGYARFLKVLPPWALAALRPFIRRTTYERIRSFIRPLAEMYVGGHRQGQDLLFHDAQAVLIFHHSPYADLGDATIACTYAMLAAETLGLGTTMIGGAAPMLQRNEGFCGKLGIPAGHTPAIALILGYPATRFLRGIRRRFVSVASAPALGISRSLSRRGLRPSWTGPDLCWETWTWVADSGRRRNSFEPRCWSSRR